LGGATGGCRLTCGFLYEVKKDQGHCFRSGETGLTVQSNACFPVKSFETDIKITVPLVRGYHKSSASFFSFDIIAIFKLNRPSFPDKMAYLVFIPLD
jgi:hypothetical protein